MLRSSRYLMAVVAMPVITGVPSRSRTRRHSNLTTTRVCPSMVRTRSTVPGHHRPLASRTTHTQTGVPGVRRCDLPSSTAHPHTGPSLYAGADRLDFKLRRQRLTNAREEFFLKLEARRRSCSLPSHQTILPALVSRTFSFTHSMRARLLSGIVLTCMAMTFTARGRVIAQDSVRHPKGPQRWRRRSEQPSVCGAFQAGHTSVEA